MDYSYSHSIQTKGKYALCTYLEFFSSKDNHLYLSILLIDSQAPGEECFGKDCRSINFRQNQVSSCAKEQIEESVNMLFVIYAMKAFKNEEEKRSRGPVLSEDKLMKTCHHEIQNQQIIVDLWWCTKDYLGGPKWLERPNGRVFCEKMFTVVDK